MTFHSFISRLKLSVIFLLLCPAALHAASDNPRMTPVVKVVQDNAAAVVNISTEHIIMLRERPYWGSYGSDIDYLFGQLLGLPTRQRAFKLNSVGSGVIVDTGGLVVTNAHVVHRASNIFVVFNDGESVPGDVVYENIQDDIAVIKIQPPRSLQAVKLAAPGDLLTGETVVAIGNPLGFENSVSAGIISGKDRELSSSKGDVIFDGLIQTDAPINPGNSGGALLNLNGELVGINVAVVQNSQSIAFAIPVDKVKSALEGHKRNQALTVKQKALRPSAPFVQNQPAPGPPRPERRWDPSEEMRRIREEMDRILQHSFGQSGGWGAGNGFFNTDMFYDTSLNIEETDQEYLIKLDMKGLNQDKMNIEVNDHMLTISGEYAVSSKEESRFGSMQSQRYGSFMRSIPLPEDADTSAIQTERQDHQLLIRLPRRK